MNAQQVVVLLVGIILILIPWLGTVKPDGFTIPNTNVTLRAPTTIPQKVFVTVVGLFAIFLAFAPIWLPALLPQQGSPAKDVATLTVTQASSPAVAASLTPVPSSAFPIATVPTIPEATSTTIPTPVTPIQAVTAPPTTPPTPTQPTSSVFVLGKACISSGTTFDLDSGRWKSDPGGDLFLENVDGIERYVDGWNGASLAVAGNVNFDALDFQDLVGATYNATLKINASLNSNNKLTPGTVVLVQTNEGRLAKVRVEKSGDYLSFSWVTYAKAGEAPLGGATIVSGPCNIEEFFRLSRK